MITEDTQLIIGLDLSLTSTGVGDILIFGGILFILKAIKTTNKSSYMERYRMFLIEYKR